MTTEALVCKLTPPVQAAMTAWRDGAVGSCGVGKKLEIRLAFGAFYGEAATLVRCALDLITIEFGHLNVADLLGFLADHASGMPRATVEADTLATKLAPTVQSIFAARKDEIVANAGPFLYREAVRVLFPWFLDSIPTLLRYILDMVSAEFGKLSINDLVTYLSDHVSSS